MAISTLLLISQLFGEADPDTDVSPDTEDPEAAGAGRLKHSRLDGFNASALHHVGDAGNAALKKTSSDSSVERVTTRSWAEAQNYHPVKLFTKVCVVVCSRYACLWSRVFLSSCFVTILSICCLWGSCGRRGGDLCH